MGIGLEFTIVRILRRKIPTILRELYKCREMLRRILREVRMDQGLIAEDMDIRPGSRYEIQTLRARGSLVIVEGRQGSMTAAIQKMADRKKKSARGMLSRGSLRNG